MFASLPRGKRMRETALLLDARPLLLFPIGHMKPQVSCRNVDLTSKPKTQNIIDIKR